MRAFHWFLLFSLLFAIGCHQKEGVPSPFSVEKIEPDPNANPRAEQPDENVIPALGATRDNPLRRHRHIPSYKLSNVRNGEKDPADFNVFAVILFDFELIEGAEPQPGMVKLVGRSNEGRVEFESPLSQSFRGFGSSGTYGLKLSRSPFDHSAMMPGSAAPQVNLELWLEMRDHRPHIGLPFKVSNSVFYGRPGGGPTLAREWTKEEEQLITSWVQTGTPTPLARADKSQPDNPGGDQVAAKNSASKIALAPPEEKRVSVRDKRKQTTESEESSDPQEPVDKELAPHLADSDNHFNDPGRRRSESSIDALKKMRDRAARSGAPPKAIEAMSRSIARNEAQSAEQDSSPTASETTEKPSTEPTPSPSADPGKVKKSVDWALAIIRKGSEFDIDNAFNYLTENEIDPKKLDEISEAVVAYVSSLGASHHDDEVLRFAAKVRTPQLERMLIAKLAEDSIFWDRAKVLQAISKYQTESAARAAAALMTDRKLAVPASTALREIGPAAESVVIDLSKDRFPSMRIEAYDILREIGTKKGLARLKSQAISDKDRAAQQAARAAAAALEMRLADEPVAIEAKDPTSDAKSRGKTKSR